MSGASTDRTPEIIGWDFAAFITLETNGGPSLTEDVIQQRTFKLAPGYPMPVAEMPQADKLVLSILNSAMPGDERDVPGAYHMTYWLEDEVLLSLAYSSDQPTPFWSYGDTFGDLPDDNASLSPAVYDQATGDYYEQKARGTIVPMQD